jgi:hypothetical protein
MLLRGRRTIMSIDAIILIGGCVAAGFWVVRSVLEPGIDGLGEGQKKPAPGHRRDPKPALREESPLSHWYLVLDVSSDASPSEIRDAVKRRLAQAESAGDVDAVRRIARAAEQGLKQRQPPPQKRNRTPNR